MLNPFKFFKPGAMRKDVQIIDQPYTGNENLKKFVEEHYKCNEFEMLRNFRKPKYKGGKYSSKLQRHGKPKEHDEVDGGYFLTIIFSIQCSLHDITKYMTLYTRFGPWLVVLTFVLIYVFIAMPLYMVFFFLSSYTKNSAMKIFLAVPILKGVSISVFTLNYLSCVLNLSLCSLNILFAIATFTPGWLDCDFQGTSVTDCIPNNYKGTLCAEANSTMPQFGSYVFLKHVITSKFGDRLNSYWIACIIVLYVIFILGQYLIKTVLVPLCRLTMYVWMILLFVIIVHSIQDGTKYTMLPDHADNWYMTLSAIFWVYCGRVSLRRVLPGDLVTYGSITITGMSPITMAVLMSLMRILFTSTIANVYAIAINNFVDYYGIENTDCIDITGLSVIYCIIPNNLMRLSTSTLATTIYFCMATYMGAMATFLTINGFVTAITDDFEDFKDFKKTIVVLLCVFMCFTNIMAIGYGFEYCLGQEMKVFIAPLLTYCCVAFFIAAYSPLRISNDFYFAFGTRLGTYWSAAMKLYVIFVMAVGTCYVTFELQHLGRLNAVEANIAALLLCSSPIVLYVALRVYTTHKEKKKIDLHTPDPNWGNPNPVLRTARQMFNPKRECRVTSELRCNHECLAASKVIEQYIAEANTKFNILKRKYLLEIEKHERKSQQVPR